MRDCLCIIPARAGSRRIKRKPLVPLGGKPMLAYSVQTALESEKFDAVVVSSDDDEILSLGVSLGATADKRPDPKVSEDSVGVQGAILDYLSRTAAREKYELVALMQPTCPLCAVEDVVAVFDLFTEARTTPSVITVTEYEYPPQFALEVCEPASGIMVLREPQFYSRPAQNWELTAAYRPNGCVLLTSVDRFLAAGKFFAEPILGHLMPAERSLDIDFPYQIRIAEALLEERQWAGRR
jgi:CMP-N,N'-diacetyllegionaminic acid synthase